MNTSIGDYADPPKAASHTQEEPFLGEFEQDTYTVTKSYLPQEGKRCF